MCYHFIDILYIYCLLILKSNKLIIGKTLAFLLGKSISFDGHTHSQYALSSHSHEWSAITGKPSTFTPSTHTHTVSQISGLSSGVKIFSGTNIGTGSAFSEGLVVTTPTSAKLAIVYVEYQNSQGRSQGIYTGFPSTNANSNSHTFFTIHYSGQTAWVKWKTDGQLCIRSSYNGSNTSAYYIGFYC